MRTVLLGSPAAMAAQHQPTPQQPHSPWRSPVPYLFGGLAAMMGLIAFALLLLACSYWKLSGYLGEENNGGDGGADLESGGGKPDDAGVAKAHPHPLEQRVVVIMAGDEKPTFLATPVSSRASSFGDGASRAKGVNGEESRREDENTPVMAAGGDDVVESSEEDSDRREEGARENREGTQQNHDRSQNGEGSHESMEGEKCVTLSA